MGGNAGSANAMSQHGLSNLLSQLEYKSDSPEEHQFRNLLERVAPVFTYLHVGLIDICGGKLEGMMNWVTSQVPSGLMVFVSHEKITTLIPLAENTFKYSDSFFASFCSVSMDGPLEWGGDDSDFAPEYEHAIDTGGFNDEAEQSSFVVPPEHVSHLSPNNNHESAVDHGRDFDDYERGY